jgi:N-acetylglucosaminyldiphosphoundecaprenol N-acetyl-beta-D-mannosaminyltransferase
MLHTRVEVLDVPVDCLNWRSTLEIVERELQSAAGPAQAIIAVNPEKVIRARNDSELLQGLRRTALLIPDGIGVVIAARLLGLGRMERIAGAELMPKICAIAERRGHGIYLLGAAPEVNERAAAALQRMFPKLNISGRHHGYVAETDMGRVIDSINASGAAVLFLALGSPRQEQWMLRHLSQTQVKLCQGIGGTLDVLAGAVKRAPPLFIKSNLEWLYRLLSQPRRLLRQTALPKFAVQVLAAMIAGLGNPPVPGSVRGKP